ncbi:MAG: type VI secretion system tip protein TssI/VgrG [Byssovorax sp.]
MALNITLSFPTSPDASAIVANGLLVQRFDLSEAMSELFELSVEILSPDPAIAEQAFVGEPVVVDFADEPFVKEIQGIVRAMVQHTAVPTGTSRYTLTVVPPLWLCTRRRDHRIFQHLSTPEIVEAVLLDPAYAGKIPRPASLLTGTFEAHEYRVQYDETDWDFIRRILADEGIATFFDHAAGSAFTLIDDTSLSAPALPATIPFSDPSQQSPIVQTSPDAPHVQSAVIASQVEIGRTAIRDYDFEKPEFVLEAKKAAAPAGAFTGEAPLESYGFEIGKFTRQGPGDDRARAMLEEALGPRRRVACTGSFALSPGTRFTLTDHPRPELDAEFMVIRARSISDFGVTSRRELELQESRARFRPPRRPKARIAGTQTAFVVGAPGEEIDVDKYGRVEVEFRWDRRDQHTGGTSRRVRVAQGWAGAGFGFVMLPRVNEEVIVAYLDGDPDEPIIVGRVHNAFVTTPLRLPEEKAVSVWRSRSTPEGAGYNEIRMDDKAGAERLWLHAQRDFRSDTGRNADTTVGVNQTVKVGGSQSIAVSGASSTSIGGDQQIKVAGHSRTEAASIELQAGTFFQANTPGNLYLSAGQDQEVTAAVNYHLRAQGIYVEGGDVVQVIAPTVHIFAGSEIHLQVGGSSLHVTGGGIKIASSGDVEINGQNVKLNC